MIHVNQTPSTNGGRSHPPGTIIPDGVHHVKRVISARLLGGTSGAYFATFQTASANYFSSSAAAGLYTPGNGHVQWDNAVLTQTGAGGAGHTITISGDAGCGT